MARRMPFCDVLFLIRPIAFGGGINLGQGHIPRPTNDARLYVLQLNYGKDKNIEYSTEHTFIHVILASLAQSYTYIHAFVNSCSGISSWCTNNYCFCCGLPYTDINTDIRTYYHSSVNRSTCICVRGWWLLCCGCVLLSFTIYLSFPVCAAVELLFFYAIVSVQHIDCVLEIWILTDLLL